MNKCTKSLENCSPTNGAISKAVPAMTKKQQTPKVLHGKTALPFISFLRHLHETRRLVPTSREGAGYFVQPFPQNTALRWQNVTLPRYCGLWEVNNDRWQNQT